jgi:hypothetical protein
MYGISAPFGAVLRDEAERTATGQAPASWQLTSLLTDARPDDNQNAGWGVPFVTVRPSQASLNS